MSWPVVSLAEALRSAEIFVDGDWVESKDQDPEGDVRLIQLADVGDGSYLDKSARFMTSAKTKQLKCTLLKPNDVLIARMPDPLGRACLFPGDAKPSVTVVDVCVVRPNENLVDSRWLMHCLNSAEVRRQINSYATGTTRSRISRSNLGKVRISFPPLPEQRQIAAILDQADALRAKRREAIVKLDALDQSIFMETFGDPIANPRNWPRKSIFECGDVITGNTPSRANEENYGDAIEWIKSDNINTPHYYVTRAEEHLSEAGRLAARTVQAGAILVTCIAGSSDCIGNAAMTDREVAFNQQINVFVPSEADPHFMYAQIRFGKRLIQLASTNGMKGMVSKSRFEQILLMFPPLDLQRDYADRVLAVEALRSRHRSSIAQLDALFSSLQHRAFRGEL